MSLAIVYSRANIGVDAPLISIEVHLANGLPCFNLVGLGDATVRESKERVRSAILNSGFEFPAKRITVNLAPADLPKDGGRFDLAIAIGIIAAGTKIPQAKLNDLEIIGELALSGSVRSVPGIIPMTRASCEVAHKVMLPEHNQQEAGMIENSELLPVSTLLEAYNHLTDTQLIPLFTAPPNLAKQHYDEDMSDIVGQQSAKRALEIAAAGNHNILFTGPPGTGKSMLAKRLITILPELSEQQALEVATIYSVAGHQIAPQNWRIRRFRQPHHTSSAIAIAGGGSIPKPGEISLAHQGVLFLDELPEFERRVLDALREPLESGSVSISRAARKTDFPAKFQLVAAMNPSPTGALNDGRSTSDQVLRYLNKVSGPFLDRMDMQVDVPKVSVGHFSAIDQSEGETSERVRERVCRCRELQIKRSGKLNAELNNADLLAFCPMSNSDRQFLHEAIDKLGMSMRAYHRILRVSRTLADLQDEKQINRQHLLEALSYRSLDAILKQLTNV